MDAARAVGYAQAPTENRALWEAWRAAARPAPEVQTAIARERGLSPRGQLYGWLAFWLGPRLAA